jgi:type I restriction enzyme R subunit
VDAAALNKWLFNTDTVDKVLAHLMTKGQKVAGGDRLGKTIVFAKNNDHAEFIAERFNVNYPHHKGQFARVVTYKTEYAQSLIDDFSIKDKAPHIAMSVDMLDTGIDVPEVVNLVFFKVVRSRPSSGRWWGAAPACARTCSHRARTSSSSTFSTTARTWSSSARTRTPPTAVGGEAWSTRLFKARLEMIAELDRKVTTGSRDRQSREPARTGRSPATRGSCAQTAAICTRW